MLKEVLLLERVARGKPGVTACDGRAGHRIPADVDTKGGRPCRRKRRPRDAQGGAYEFHTSVKGKKWGVSLLEAVRRRSDVHRHEVP